MSLAERHLAFVAALRVAGLPVAVSEGLDALAAMEAVGLADREVVRESLAATLVKRQVHRPGFDALFDLWFPPLVGHRHASLRDGADGTDGVDGTDSTGGTGGTAEDRPREADRLREALVAALLDGDRAAVAGLALDAVEGLGSMPGRGPGLAAWSSYNTMRALDEDRLVLALSRALMTGARDRAPRSEALAMQAATGLARRAREAVEAEVRRRIAEDRGPEHVARTTLRPPVDRLDFLTARADDVVEMRRQVQHLSRRLAARLAKEQHHRRRGAVDMRRTMRASLATGGVPLETHHRPRRPHRPELVVLCDVSGSVASFASFTLLLVYALREQFTAVRAFTFVDDVHEVSDDFRRGGDPEETLLRLAESARHASRWGRTDYGRAFAEFRRRHADALGPRTSLLVLGDARSNHTDPRVDELRAMREAVRRGWWLNPEHPRQWGTGDSAAREYAAVLPMLECRNLAQLGELVHDLV